jgi:DNA-binding NarL/FixJ family response regulator
MLRIGVTDDGRGGADPARGTGLHGIERRLAAFDGVLALTSPSGGPTVVNMEIPCALSSPKTSSCSETADPDAPGARELLAGGAGGIGYLLKDRVFDSAQFIDAVRRVAGGGTAMDPEVIARLLARNSGDGAFATLSPREREVLGLMAEGRSNAAIAQQLVITERAVAKHTASIFLRLGLQPSDDDNRRVLAVIAYLGQ